LDEFVDPLKEGIHFFDTLLDSLAMEVLEVVLLIAVGILHTLQEVFQDLLVQELLRL